MLIAGLVLGSLAGLELAAREHFAGYRSHSSLLAACAAFATGALVVIALPGPVNEAPMAIVGRGGDRGLRPRPLASPLAFKRLGRPGLSLGAGGPTPCGPASGGAETAVRRGGPVGRKLGRGILTASRRHRQHRGEDLALTVCQRADVLVLG